MGVPSDGVNHLTSGGHRYRHRPELPFKNGKYPVILLAGGPEDRANEIRELLADRRGALVLYHWPWKNPRKWQRPVPNDVDLVIGLKSMMGHPDENLLKHAAKRAGVPVVITDHKWIPIASALRCRWSNFELDSRPPLPLNARGELIEVPEPEPEPAPLLEPAPLPALPASVEVPPVEVPPVEEHRPPATDENNRISEARLAHAVKDTMLLVRELQERLHSMGFHAMLIDLEQVTFSTGKLKAKGGP